MASTLDPNVWKSLPFHFWSAVFFVFGTMVGSFLNVCIHRLPLGQSIVSPPSHCPHCKYSIPWYLNIPLITWLALRGRCRNCGAPISIRYFLVELLTGVVFLAAWVHFGPQSVAMALVSGFFLSGLIAASFIDFEHFIIPDQLTIGGMVAGAILSCQVLQLQGAASLTAALKQSLLGMAVGAGAIYLVLRGGKLLFGRQRLALPADTMILFTETGVTLPDKEIPFEDLFYRASDVIVVRARQVELPDRCYKDVLVRLSPDRLQVGEDKFNPEEVAYLEALSGEIVLPREAMGFGDVKFMGAIGAFLGWKAVVFSLMVSSMIGSLVGITLVALRKQAWSSRLPYGPCIALAAALWVFVGKEIVALWLGR